MKLAAFGALAGFLIVLLLPMVFEGELLALAAYTAGCAQSVAVWGYLAFRDRR